MKQHDYTCSISANITTKEAIKSINQVSEWWAKDFKGSSQKLGDIFTVRFGETFVTFKRTEVVANNKIV